MNRPFAYFGELKFDLSAAAACEIAIPLDFDGPQPSFFGAPPARRTALAAGGFIGDVRHGGSCNCERLELTPHCHGTHTECVGHLTRQRTAAHRLIGSVMTPAVVVTVEPASLAASGESGPQVAQPGDLVVTRAALEQAVRSLDPTEIARALVLRTLPNAPEKRHRDWMSPPGPAWLTREAATWLVERKIQHLLVDLPSVDRADDGGELVAHRTFWGLAPGERDLAAAARPGASITEMIFVPDDLPDGCWLLSLQLPALQTDAVPSRPILYPTFDRI